jgi:hypothetical protein
MFRHLAHSVSLPFLPSAAAVAVALVAVPMVGCGSAESSNNPPVGESQEAIKQCPGDPPPPFACWEVICTGPLSDPYWDYRQQPMGTACQGDGACDASGSCIHRPAAPSLQLVSVTTDTITLQWNATTFADSYRVNNNTTNSLVSGFSETSFAWGGLGGAGGRQFCFTVNAMNYFFLSAPSNQVCATVLSATPIWVRTATSSCGDQCGMPNCSCISDICPSSSPAGQGCSPAGDSCNVISGPSFIEYTCE